MSNVNIERPNVTVNVSQDVSVALERPSVTLELVAGGIVPVSQDITRTAGVNLSALRVVTLDASGNAVYATNTSVADSVVLGVTLTAANSGAAVGIRAFGIIEDNAWSFAKGPVFLGTNGTLTQTAPTGGAVIVHVARALTANTIFVDTDTTIQTV